VIEIELNNRQSAVEVDPKRLVAGVHKVLHGERIARAEISLAVVDDETICRLNRQYLGHDRATDVLGFVFEHAGDRLEGEIVASAETAARTAAQYDWATADELLLYVIHGALHLVGYDDTTDEDLARMRQRERHYLAEFQLVPRYDQDEQVPQS